MSDEEYTPIAGSVHDKLEESAVMGRRSHFVFRDDDGGTRELQDHVADLFARDGVAYLKTDGGMEIRLDRLEEVNGERVVYEEGEG